MEHVPDIAAGFAEMARVLKPGGIIFSMASPLWFSPYGHHMGCFAGHPWIHVVFDREGILRYSKDNGIEGERGHSVDALLDYMLDRTQFNMRAAEEYLAATSNLPRIVPIENELLKEAESLLKHPLGRAAVERGYTADQLLSVTHRLIAGKAAAHS
jgi:ubiquinone/menaquinone biosynthesis C-methylase UbiE